MSTAADTRQAVEEHLDAVREDTTRNAVALLVIIAVGVAAVWVHWTGLIAAGVLIGLISRSLVGAMLNAAWFGVVVLAVFGVSQGTVALGFFDMVPIIYVTIATAIVLPVYGSLVRGLI